MDHQPLDATVREIDLDPRLGALPFRLENDALAKLAMTDTLADPKSSFP